MTRFILAILAWLLPIVSLATGEVHFQRVSVGDGLTQSSITSMAQCDDGYMWFGTLYGLNRYDGYEFKSYRHDFGDPASLSNSAVTELECAGSGHLWVKTRNGLNRFNTRTGLAERFFPPEALRSDDGRTLINILGKRRSGLLFLQLDHAAGVVRPGSEQIEVLPFATDVPDHQRWPSAGVVDSSDRLWLLNPAGLWRLDDTSGRMVRVRQVEPVARDGQQIILLETTTDGRLALVTGAGLELVDPDRPQQSERFRPSRRGHADDGIEGLATTGDGSIWMVLDTTLVRFLPASDDWQVVFDGGKRETGLRRDVKLQMIEDRQGDYWLAGLYGVGRWLRESERLQLFFHRPGDDRSIPPTLPSSGYGLFIDSHGTVWVGSHLGGLAHFSPQAHRFEHIRDRSAPSEIPYAGHNVVRGVAEQVIDDEEHLWVALDAAGLRQWRRRPGGGYEWVRSFHANGPEGERLPGDLLWGVVVDPHSHLVWALESRHLVGIDPVESSVVTILPIFDKDSAGSSRTLRFSADGSVLWVGTSLGVDEYLVGEDRSRLTRSGRRHELVGQGLYNLLELPDGRLLGAGRQGLELINFDSDSPNLFFGSDEIADSPATRFFGLALHPDDGFWVGSSKQGLAHVRLDESDNGALSVQWFGPEHGLVDNTIYAILVEDDGQLWLSSNRGLMRFDPDSQRVHHFTPPDGVQHFEFSNAVAHVGSSGRFYFGGINGVNAFRPERIKSISQPPEIRLQEIRVDGVPVPMGSALPVQLNLPHHRNDLEITFVGLHFAAPRRNRYAFMLDGLDSDWNNPGQQRQVRYAGLAPGNYRFVARAANSDGVWSDEHVLLNAVIRRPAWQTTWAYLGYVLAAVLLMVLAYGFHLGRRRALEAEVSSRTLELQKQQALIRQQAAELRDALEARSRFFANISHEFRTPLTLIQSSLERLEAEGGERAAIERGRRYSRLLLSLVDQLLDLSRLRAANEAEPGKPWSLTSVAAFSVDAFRHTAAQRGLELHSELEDGWWTPCSQEHVEKILLNLLANAVKFTSPGDTVVVRLAGAGDGAVLEVIDSGPGIPAEEQEQVFQQFHRSATAISDGIEGAGIGLALVREMALAMGGDVVLESEPGRGSHFSVFLPAFIDRSLNVDGTRLQSEPEVTARAESETIPVDPASSTGEQMASGPGKTVLVVEDNPDLRDHLRQTLMGHWQVLLAADGRQGLELAASHHPDVVISDIMMPALDGFGLLEQLRDNPETSHIPVMLLTARQDSEARLKGLTLSADDFMAKPFDTEELRARIQRMLDNRQRLRRYLLSESAFERADNGRFNQDLMRRDRELVASVNQCLAEGLADPDFDVQALCASLAIERRTLQRKLKSLIGMTPAVYIRHLRLKHARRLLLETDRSINEIALACGFSSSQSFSRSFRKHFQSSPEKWRRDNCG